MFLDNDITKWFHFNILVGDNDLIKKEVLKKIKNYDHLIFEGGVLKINIARQIKKENSYTSSKPKIILINFYQYPIDSQNTLLKTFEETEENTYFLLITSKKENLIKTILSRGNLIETGLKKEIQKYDFFELNFKEKEKFLENLKEHKEILNFFSWLEKTYFSQNQNLEKYQKFLKLKELLQTKNYDRKKILDLILIWF